MYSGCKIYEELWWVGRLYTEVEGIQWHFFREKVDIFILLFCGALVFRAKLSNFRIFNIALYSRHLINVYTFHWWKYKLDGFIQNLTQIMINDFI